MKIYIIYYLEKNLFIQQMEQKLKYQLEHHTTIGKQLKYHLERHTHINQLSSKNSKIKTILMIKVDKVDPAILLKQEEWIEELDINLYCERIEMEEQLDNMLNKQLIQKEKMQIQKEEIQTQQEEIQKKIEYEQKMDDMVEKIMHEIEHELRNDVDKYIDERMKTVDNK